MAYKTWSLTSVTAGAPADFIAPASGAAAVVSMARLANTGSSDGTLTVTRTDNSNNVLATLLPGVTLPAKSVVEMPALLVLGPHKIRVTCSVATLSCDAQGSEA